MITMPMPNMVATATAINVCLNFKNVGRSEVSDTRVKLRLEIHLDNGHFNNWAYAPRTINSRLVACPRFVLYVKYRNRV